MEMSISAATLIFPKESNYDIRFQGTRRVDDRAKQTWL